MTKERIIQAALAIFTLIVLYNLLTGHNYRFLSLMFRWGEITVVFFLMAGILRFIVKKAEKIKSGENRVYSVVIVISFALTVFAGFFNLASERFAWENMVRDHPQYLLDVTKAVIEDDPYLRHHPSKNKLVLLIASRSSNDFTPSKEMLLNAGMTFGDFRSISGKSGVVSHYDSVTLSVINKDDLRLIPPLVEKVNLVSQKVVAAMLPFAPSVKQWFISSLTLFDGTDISMSDLETKHFSDLMLGDTYVEGSGELLNKAIGRFISGFGQPSLPKVDIGASFNKVFSDPDLTERISEVIYPELSTDLSKSGTRLVVTSFLKTGVSSLTPVRGILRWIYRHVFDPLYSAFGALLLIFTMFAVFKVFNHRSYSYAVISLSFIVVLTGFLPQIDTFLYNIMPDGWEGPGSSEWMISVPALAAFKAVLIGAGIGVTYIYLRSVFSFLYLKKGN